MLFFTHLYLAKKAAIKTPSGAYLVGAVLPDIRYLTSTPREITHISTVAFSSGFPLQNELFKGYLTHLLVDRYTNESKVYAKAKAALPWLYRRVMNGMMINLFLELHYLEKYQESNEKYQIAAQYDQKLMQLGIKDTDFHKFVTTISDLVTHPDLEHLLKIIQESPNLRKNPKVRKYYALGGFLIRRKWLTRYFLKKLSPVIAEFEAGFSYYLKEKL